MTEQEILTKIGQAIETASNKKAEISLNSDLIKDKILDSLDAMIFIMELENEFDKRFPEDINLAEEGYYQVKKLVDFFQA